MADNNQTTDPLAEQAAGDGDDHLVPWDAEETFPEGGRDPGKNNNGGAPLWRGAQASDF